MKKRLIALLGAATMPFGGCADTGGNDGQAAGNQAGGQANAAQTAALPDADPAIWVVRDEDTTIYLFGTFHLLDGRSDWFNDEVRQAFDQAQDVVFEVPMPADEAEMARQMQPLIIRYAQDRSGRPFSADLTPEENAKLAELMSAAGAPPAALAQFKPWFVSLMLTNAIAQKLGLNPKAGAESVIQQAARARNLPVSGVETLESQIRIFDSAPREAQIRQLKEQLANVDKLQDELGRMLAVWNAGDAEGMEQMLNEGMRDNPQMRRVLLENRNRNWAAWIDARMDRPGTVFMAVGAGHLVGPDSVQALLRERNIQSERVPPLTPQ